MNESGPVWEEGCRSDKQTNTKQQHIYYEGRTALLEEKHTIAKKLGKVQAADDDDGHKVAGVRPFIGTVIHLIISPAECPHRTHTPFTPGYIALYDVRRHKFFQASESTDWSSRYRLVRAPISSDQLLLYCCISHLACIMYIIC